MCSISSLEVLAGGLEGLLEGRGDLAVGLADQLRELVERLLEVLALRLELGDVALRVLVLALGERVDGAELLAAADQPLDRGTDRGPLLLVERLRLRRRVEVEAGEDPLPLRLSLLAAVAQARCPDLGLGDALADEPELAVELGLDPRAFAKLERQLVARPSADDALLDGRGAGADGVPGRSEGRAESGERLRQLRFDLDPLLERVLAAVAEHVLGPTRRAGGALGAAANPGERLEPGADIAGLDCGGDRLARLRQRRSRRLELPCERRLRVTLGGAELGGEGAERRATPLDRRAELGLAAGDRLGPGAEPLVRGTQRGQLAPDCGALAVALGEPLLDGVPALARSIDLRLDRVALAAGVAGRLLGRREVPAPG